MWWSYGCNHYNETGGCTFLRIPKNAKVKKDLVKIAQVSCEKATTLSSFMKLNYSIFV